MSEADPLDHDEDGRKGGDAAAKPKAAAKAKKAREHPDGEIYEYDTRTGRTFAVHQGDNTFYQEVSYADLADTKKDAATKARAKLAERIADR